ncbi:MAG: hypothetical protein G8237_07890 [Magnetococcales bacterium]|nr:hypothetical protein [Magnetococcales bacterium]NGZ06263.1 hypothetical protein [Magnetococcales bacterium]
MRQRINETMNKIEQLGLTEAEFKRILSRLSDTELALLEQLTAMHRLAESEMRRLQAIVEKVYQQLQETFRSETAQPARAR